MSSRAEVILAVLSLLLAISAIAWLAGLTTISSIGLACVVTVAGLIPLVLAFKRSGAAVLEPHVAFGATTAVFFGLGSMPFILNTSRLTEPDSASAIPIGLGAVLIGYGAFVLGVKVVLRSPLTQLPSRSYALAPAAFALVLVLVWVGRVYFLTRGIGYGRFIIATDLLFRALTPIESTMFQGLVVLTGLVGPLTAIVAWQLRGRRALAIAIPILVGETLYFGITGSKTPLAWVLIGAGLTWLALGGAELPRRRVIIATFATAVFVMIPYVEAVHAEVLSGKLELGEDQLARTTDLALSAGERLVDDYPGIFQSAIDNVVYRFSAVDLLTAVVQAMLTRPDVDPSPEGLSQAAEILVPRLLWPDKPETGKAAEKVIEATYFGYEWDAVSTPYSDLLGSLGPIGLVVGMFVFGVIVSAVLMLTLRATSYTGSLLAWFTGASGLVIAQTTLAAAASSIRWAIIAVVVIALLERLMSYRETSPVAAPTTASKIALARS